MIYLYRVTNLINRKFYIGVHKSDNENDSYMGSGTLIRRAIEKYGISNFKKEIIEMFDTYDSALAREKEIVNEEFLSRDDVYNLKEGGLGGWDYVHKNRLYSTGYTGYTGEKHHSYGKTNPKTSGKNHCFYGKERPEHSERMKGDKNPNFGKIGSMRGKTGELSPNFGKKFTEEVNSKKGRAGDKNHMYGNTDITAFNLVTKGSCRISKEEFYQNKGTIYVGIKSALAQEFLNGSKE